MKEIVYKIKDAKFYNRKNDGKLCSLEITLEGESKDIIDEFNFMELENYNITSEDQLDKVRKMLKDYCYTDEEIDDVINILAKEDLKNG